MKLLLITSIYPSEADPFQGVYIRRVKEIHEELGYEVTLVRYKKSPHLLGKLAATFSFFRQIRKHISSGHYDLINVHYPFLASIPFWGMKVNRPLITTLHGTDVKHDSWFRTWFDRPTGYLLRQSDCIMVNSEYFKQYVSRKFKLDGSKIHLCPAGGYNSRDYYQKDEMSAGEAAPAGRVRWLGFASRIIEKKGWRLCLQAYEELIRDPEIPYELGLKIAGDGREFVLLECEVKRLIDKSEKTHIEVLGNLDDPSMGEFYRSLDLFLFPTLLEESLGLVAIESMACGTPVVASRLGAVGEYIRDGENGYLVEAGNIGELKESVIRFFQLSESGQRALGRQAADSVQHFNREFIRECYRSNLEAVRGK